MPTLRSAEAEKEERQLWAAAIYAHDSHSGPAIVGAALAVGQSTRRRRRLAGAHRRGHPGRDRRGGPRRLDPAQFGNRDPVAGAHLMNLPGARLMKHPTGAIIIVAALLGLPGAPWMPHAAAMPIERVTSRRAAGSRPGSSRIIRSQS